MNKKKKIFPTWFSQYSPPREPYEPKKPEKNFLQEARVLYSEQGSGSKIKKIQLDELDFDYIEVESSNDDPYDSYGYSTPELRVIKEIYKDKTEKQLAREMKAWEKACEKYKEEKRKHELQLEEWKKLKAEWDAQRLKEQEDFEKKEFERLNKKFGKKS